MAWAGCSAAAAHFLEVWEGSLSNGSLISLLRAAASNDDAANAVRSILGGQVVPMLAPVVPPTELSLRAGLVATQRSWGWRSLAAS
jgi:hypothetical protein